MMQIFAATAGIIHVYIFILESILWGTPKVNRAFAMTPEQAKENKLFAFNQGYYNLFLAIGAIAGVVLAFSEHLVVAQTLICFTCASMLGASLVLLWSTRRLTAAVFIQGLPPALAIIFFVVQFQTAHN